MLEPPAFREDTVAQVVISPRLREDIAVRVANYLQDCGLQGDEELAIMIDQVMERVTSDLRERRDDETFAEFAVRQAQAMLDEWLAPLLENADRATLAERAALREAFLYCRGLERWCMECLRSGRLPEAAVATLRQAVAKPTPTPAALAMVPQDIEFISPFSRLRRLFRRLSHLSL